MSPGRESDAVNVVKTSVNDYEILCGTDVQ